MARLFSFNSFNSYQDMKTVTVDRQNDRQIDIEFRVRYQYVESQQSEKHLRVLVKFLAEQHKQTERGED